MKTHATGSPGAFYNVSIENRTIGLSLALFAIFSFQQGRLATLSDQVQADRVILTKVMSLKTKAMYAASLDTHGIDELPVSDKRFLGTGKAWSK